VKTLGGVATFADPHRLRVADALGEVREIEAERVVIAVGTRPYRPDHLPFNDDTVVDSDTLVSNLRVPRSLTVVGAGVIGIEYATIFSALDVPVTIVEPRARFLEFVDHEIIEEFQHDLRKRGVNFRIGCKLDSVEIDADGKPVAHLSDGRQVRSDMLLYAAGRIGATDGLGLGNCGIEPDDRGRLHVNPRTFQTSVPHIYAAGDVIGFPSLASTSMEQGRIAACHAFNAHMPPAPEYFPYGIYSVPEISMVGLTEDEARDRSIQFECGIARFRETSRGHIMGLESGMMKLLFELGTRKLLGVHIIGEGATELVHIGQAVLNFGGTLDYFVENTFNYPTLAEAYKIAALDAFNRMPAAEAGAAAAHERSA
ncbi:MAG: Si-specific NAD(P)(+) transhydrogenase, partial [Cucumibacter sp.]